MIAQDNRISRAEFMNYLRGKRYAGVALTVTVSPAPTLKVSVVVSKKVAKRAVDRNRLRRRAYGVIERWLKQSQFIGVVVVQYKPGALRLSRVAVQAELEALLAQISDSR